MTFAMALASVRHRAGGFAGSFLAVALTVTLLTVSGLLMYTALTAGPGPDRFAAATLTVARDRAVTLTSVWDKGDKVKTKTKSKPLTGAAVLPAGTVRRIAAVDGVARAVPDVAFPVDLVGADGRLRRGPGGSAVVAHGWASAALTPYRLASGSPPREGQVVLDASLGGRVCDRVRLTSKTGVREFRVSGVTSGVLGNQGAVFLADGQVPAVSGLRGPTAVAVVADPGVPAGELAGRLRGVVGDASVYRGADRVRADLPIALTDYVPAVSVFGIMLGVTVFAGVFVLVGSVGLVVGGRLRELALLRTVGATPRQLRRLLAAETAVVAVVAGALGGVAGSLLAGPAAGRFRDAGVVPAQFEVSVDVLVPVGAVLVGLAVSQVSARVAAGRATRIAPTQALRETAVAPPARTALRAAVAVLAAAGGAAVLIFAPLRGNMALGMGFISAALLLCAAAAAGPLLVAALGAALGPVVSATGVTGRLAAATVRAASRRVAAVALPLMLLVGTAATLLLTSTLTARIAADQQAARTAPATVQLTPRGSGAPLPVARGLAGEPGVRGMAATLPTTVVIDDGGKPEHHAAQGLLSFGDTALDLGTGRAGLPDLGGRGVAVSADLAAGQHWRTGRVVTVWLPDATRVRLRVVATYRLSAGFGDLVLPAPLVAGHDPRGTVGAVYLAGRPDHPPAGFTVSHQTRPPGDAGVRGAAFDTLIAILVGFIAISVANTFAIATVARRREFTALRLAGATGRQVHRMVGRETLLAVLVGLLLGCAVTATVYEAFSLAQDGRWRWASDPTGLAALLAGAALLGLVAGAVPVRLVVRRRALPADAR